MSMVVASHSESNVARNWPWHLLFVWLSHRSAMTYGFGLPDLAGRREQSARVLEQQDQPRSGSTPPVIDR
jgi:hypothetical protein